MGHVYVYIWKIYVNSMLNQGGHTCQESQVNVRKKNVPHICTHVIRIHVRCKEYTHPIYAACILSCI